ncbi:sulfatase [Salmonella enterica subsp. enterica]|uniref:Sulfatase n=1 Tax=Salmonella enterica I TaxID=59201 RepID=A0A379X028_SALET|nr:sulfatase [Salmonella enterica subsp. enterica]
MINDGRYTFARYFSLREHNTPETWEILLSTTILNSTILKMIPMRTITLLLINRNIRISFLR